MTFESFCNLFVGIVDLLNTFSDTVSLLELRKMTSEERIQTLVNYQSYLRREYHTCRLTVQRLDRERRKHQRKRTQQQQQQQASMAYVFCCYQMLKSF